MVWSRKILQNMSRKRCFSRQAKLKIWTCGSSIKTKQPRHRHRSRMSVPFSHLWGRKQATTSSPGPSPRSKWRSEKPLAKAAKVAPKVQSSLEFRHANTMKCLRFVWIKVSDCRKQGRQTLETTFEKAISSCVTWQNTPRFWTIRGVFQHCSAAFSARGCSDRQFDRGEGPGDEAEQATLRVTQSKVTSLTSLLSAGVRTNCGRKRQESQSK